MAKDLAPPLGGGRYRLLRELGRGGFATVYEALDTRLDVARAVKVLSREGGEHARLRFETEARLLASFEHPHVLAVHDVGEDAGVAWLVMELARGGSLHARVQVLGPLGPRMAAQAIGQALAALAYVHGCGVVHRDLKPSNLLVTHQGLVKVADFGIAQDRELRLTQTGAAMGSLGYTAPEQLRDAKRSDARSDLFSVGATLYSLVTGRRPEGLDDPDQRADLIDGVPPVLARVLLRATRVRPEDRYGSAEEMAEALGAAVERLPPDPEQPPLGVPLAEPSVGPAATLSSWSSEGGWAVEPLEPAPPEPVAPGRSGWVPFVGGLVVGALGLGAGLGVRPLGVTSTEASPSEVGPELGVVETLDVAAVASSVGASDPVDLTPSGLTPSSESGSAPPPDPSTDHAETAEMSTVQPPVSEPAPAGDDLTPSGLTPLFGMLFVNSRPWSELTVDGEPRGRTGWSGELAAGGHELELVTEDGRRHARSIDIPTDGELRLCWDFDLEASCTR